MSLYLIYEHCAFPAASQSCRKIPRETRPPSPLERNAPSQKHRQTARASPIFFSDQYKIRFPVTKNPPSRNRKPCFVSSRRQPLCPFGHADVSPWLSAAQRPYVLMFLCPYVFRVSGSRVPATAPALMSFRPRGRQSVAAAAQRPYVLMFLCPSVSRVSGFRTPPTASALMSLETTRTPVRGRQPRSGLMCILCKLMSLMFSALSGKHERHIFCPYVLLSFCFPR